MPPMLELDGRPTFLLGVNYWSRAGGPRMWDRFDEEIVRGELRQMRGVGLNVCRSFAFIPSFMPRPPRLSRPALARFRRFLGLCAEAGIATIPTALVGHMSGENWPFPGQRGRSPYTDRVVLGWERQMVRAVASCAARSPAVCAYLASNEMPLWGGPAEVETIVDWATRLRRTLHLRDRRRPFGLGDGVMNLGGGQNGFDPQALRDVVDFVGPHTYYSDEDAARQAYNAEYCLRSLTHLGLPVLFEEFGGSAAQMSEANQALYFREVIHACLGVGAAGALAWCFSDFDLGEERPYLHHAFELQFGITRADGSERPVCEELRKLRRLIDLVDPPTLEPPRPAAAILVPSTFNTDYPFSSDDRARMRRVLLESYLLAASAGLEVELCPEGGDLSRYRLILCSSTQKLLATTWSELLRRARAGATVYWSAFMGDEAHLQGPWCQLFEQLTGCRHELRYGCYDAPDERVRIEGEGLGVRIDVQSAGRTPCSRARLPIEPFAADVLAHDAEGRPALTRARHGQGQVIFLAYPLEHYLGAQAVGWEARSGAFALYGQLGEMAGLRPAVRVEDPGVQRRLVRAPGGDLLWLFNHRWQPVSTVIDSPGGQPLLGPSAFRLPAPDSQPLREGSSSITLPAKGAAIYRLVRTIA
jgi:endo-1,4-beta-mannosidase